MNTLRKKFESVPTPNHKPQQQQAKHCYFNQIRVKARHLFPSDQTHFSRFCIFFLFIPTLALKVRRVHDVNKSGWWILIAFTGIGYFLLLYWYCLKGTLGANYYGEDIEAGRS
jgi:uncharacterized membrane protein YhaH (DUF805 family)